MWSDTCGNRALCSMQKWHIGNDVRTILINDAEIAGRVGEDIYPIVAPEGTMGAFILYQRIKYSKDTVKAGVYEDVCHLLLTAVADNYDLALDLASLIDNALVGKHKNDFGEEFSIRLLDSSETFDDNKFIEELTFEIK